MGKQILAVFMVLGAAVGVGVVALAGAALMALAESKKHFIALTWDANGSAFQKGAPRHVDRSHTYGEAPLGREKTHSPA